MSLVDLERTVFRMLSLRLRSIDHKVPAETLLSAELLVAHLVANRTRHSVLRLLRAIRIHREEGEDLALLTLQLGFIARDRHVADGAVVFHLVLRFGMVDRLAP